MRLLPCFGNDRQSHTAKRPHPTGSVAPPPSSSCLDSSVVFFQSRFTASSLWLSISPTNIGVGGRFHPAASPRVPQDRHMAIRFPLAVHHWRLSETLFEDIWWSRVIRTSPCELQSDPRPLTESMAESRDLRLAPHADDDPHGSLHPMVHEHKPRHCYVVGTFIYVPQRVLRRSGL